MFMLETVCTVRLAQRGLDPSVVGLVAALNFVATVVLIPALPFLVRRVGEHRLNMASSAAMPVAAVAFTLSDSVVWWALLEVVVGACFGVRWVLSDSQIARAAPPEIRGRVVGLYEAVAGACMLTGPAIVAATLHLGPVPFLVAAAIACLNAVVVNAVGAGASVAGPSAPTGASAMSFLAALRLCPALAIASFVGGVFEIGSSSILPAYAVSALAMGGSAAALLGTAVGIGSLATQRLAGSLADRGRARQAVLASIVLLVAAAALPMLAGVPGVVVAAVVWGAAGGACYTLAQILIGNAMRGPAVVACISVIAMAYMLGCLAAPLVGGLATRVFGQLGLPATFLVVAAVGLLGVVRTRWLGSTPGAASAGRPGQWESPGSRVTSDATEF